ncbi:hypothetical protein RD792_006311 [Penstemon davidsonii]|uniref:RING-type domain-containing protein n=1 Tax=Penstemon davidsonii TaxID=160366 RepID=A0ABR0DDI3_9LAMI|nr:hypothetical protein RD792_006311 [Penstemon davidsonii]
MDDDDDRRTFFRRENRYDINSRIMITAIISLSFIVLLVTILHIYARFMFRRQARRQAALRHLGFATSPTTEPPVTGLDPSIITALPVFMFKQTNLVDNSNEMSHIECAVCLSTLQDGEMVRTLPNCKHTFHANCIDQWLGTNSTCPNCRTEAEPRLVTEPREGVAISVGVPPSAPPIEGVSDGGGGAQFSAKISGSSSSRLSSFRRILSWERSSRRIQVAQSCGQDGGSCDLERQ